MDYTRNFRYFKPSRIGYAIVAIIFTLLYIYGSNFNPMGTIIGLIIIALGIYFIMVDIKYKLTDAELDEMIDLHIKGMKSHALNKLGIDEDEVNEIAPICFHGYIFDNNALIKQGKDGLFRSSKCRAVMFFFSDNEVHCFTYDFSIIEDDNTEATDVYFYKDIVTVSTQTKQSKYFGRVGQNNHFDYEYFKLTTTGGSSISCTVERNDDVQRSINGMRSLIRSKKMA